jgi:hypothetical protein
VIKIFLFVCFVAFAVSINKRQDTLLGILRVLGEEIVISCCFLLSLLFREEKKLNSELVQELIEKHLNGYKTADGMAVFKKVKSLSGDVSFNIKIL